MNTSEYSSQLAEVFSLDYEGRGVARINGKAVFIKGALPSEKVTFRITKSKKQFDEAEVVSVLQASDARIKPQCGYFDTCGGCVLQHVDADTQVAFKQRIFEEQLERIGKVIPEQILPPIYGMAWHYRDRARLSIDVDKKGRLKMGFQAKRSNEVVDIRSCELLADHVSEKMPEIQKVLQKISDGGSVPKFIECFTGTQISVLNISFLKMPSEKILSVLRQWFDDYLAKAACRWQIWVQYERLPPTPFYPECAPELMYELPEFDVKMPYRPGDFTQVNGQMNAVMIGRALKLLDIQVGDKVADLFCGLGNFTLPMAKAGAYVTGIEGVASLTQRARDNAVLNHCSEKVKFHTADLFEIDEATVASWGRFDKMLLDPPRSGAFAVVKSLHKPYLPKRIVYVSCNPATFARDAAVLVEKGYAFKAAGIMNMFAQTAHIESIGVFEL